MARRRRRRSSVGGGSDVCRLTRGRGNRSSARSLSDWYKRADHYRTIIITTATTTTIQYTTLLLYELNLHTRSLCILKANSHVIYIKFRILLCLRNSRTSVCVSARSTYTVLQQITDAAAYKLQAK